jgi:hypothetical protein
LYSEGLNEFFWAWLEVAYHQKPHGSLKKTPKNYGAVSIGRD